MIGTDIICKVDEIGRIVIPIELRKLMDIREKEPLEIMIEDDVLILKRHHDKKHRQLIKNNKNKKEKRVYQNMKLVVSPDGEYKLYKEIK